MITGVLAVLALVSGGLDRDTAVERARALMAKLGYGRQLSLKSVTRAAWPEESLWVGFMSEFGTAFIAFSAKDARVVLVQVPMNPEDMRGMNVVPSAKLTGYARDALRTLGYGDGVRLDANTGFVHDQRHAIFYCQLRGHRFFNLNPTYGLQMLFDPGTERLSHFIPAPPLPPINATASHVSSSDALAKLSRWVLERRKSRHEPPQLPGEAPLVPELGYWKFAKEPIARLVWRGQRYTQIKGRSYAMGPERILVDALTAELLEPDDPLWH